jgi:hypothetical protein
MKKRRRRRLSDEEVKGRVGAINIVAGRESE